MNFCYNFFCILYKLYLTFQGCNCDLVTINLSESLMTQFADTDIYALIRSKNTLYRACYICFTFAKHNKYTEIGNVKFLLKHCHWLRRKLSFSQLKLQPLTNILSKWRHFRDDVSMHTPSMITLTLWGNAYSVHDIGSNGWEAHL